MSTNGHKVLEQAKLTPKLENFCREYLVDFNATQAAIRAGYSRASAHVQAFDHLKKPRVISRIAELRAATAKEYNITKEKLMRNLMEIAGTRLEDITDPVTGAVLPMHDWPEHMKGTVSGIDLEEIREGRGKTRRVVGYNKKVRLWEKTKAIEVLNKMLGFNAPEKVAPVTPDGEALAPVINIITIMPKQEDF